MAHTSYKITAPVSFADVNAVLGTAHTDLGLLCKDSHINKWAKYKPVVKNLILTSDQLDSNNKWKSSATWWKGTYNNCGISYVSYTTIANARTAIVNKTPIWAYTKPSGGSTSPYRLVDFNQYDHNALPPTTEVNSTPAYKQTGSVLTITAVQTSGVSEWLRLNDIGDFANYYYLAAIYDGSGNLKLLQTSSKKVGQYSNNENIEVTIGYTDYNLVLSEGSTYYAFLMLSSVAYSASSSPINGTYIPLPTDKGNYGMQAGSFECKSGATSAFANAYVLFVGNKAVNWEVQVYGVGNPTTIDIRIVYAATGQIVGNLYNHSLPFSAYSTAYNGGYKRVSRPQDTPQMVLPDTNYNQYRFEVIVSSTLSARSPIGYPIT